MRVFTTAVFVVSPYSTGSPAAAFINGKHDGTWPLEDTLTSDQGSCGGIHRWWVQTNHSTVIRQEKEQIF